MSSETNEESREAAMKAAPLDLGGPSIEDMAAHDYRLLIPKFYAQTEHMSKKQLHRLLKCLIEYPLEMDYPKLSFSDEKKAFETGMIIFDCKHVLLEAALKIAKDKQKSAQLQLELNKQMEEQNVIQRGLPTTESGSVQSGESNPTDASASG